MKKSIIMLAMMTSVITIAQKKNGVVYSEHPAIDVTTIFAEALVSGDTTKISSLLTDDFKSFNGVSTNPDMKGTDKSKFLAGAIRWSNELDYFSITDFPGSYPDAIQYKKDNKKDEVWVQTWELLKGVHNVTGVKFSSPVHRLFLLTKDKKIKRLISYYNERIFVELGESFANRSNGTIYNHHDNINTVRKSVYAFENSDIEKSLSYFKEDALFFNINDDFNEPSSKKDVQKVWHTFLENFEIKSIEMVGYPDYLEYEMDNGRSVLSWWNFHLIRKADKKEIEVPIHLNHDFDEDGKIAARIIYYNGTLLEQ